MDKTKFNSCKFNDGEKERTQQGCCFTIIDFSYYCLKRKIYKLHPILCQQCSEYINKNEENKISAESQISASERNI